MADNSSGFTKPLSVGVSLENGYFDVDGAAGFSINAYAGRLNFSFWRKSEKSSENRDNKLSININQAIILNNYVQAIVRSRNESFIGQGIESYKDITNLVLAIEGFVSNQNTIFGIVRFDTVEIEGIKRIKMTVTRGTTVNSVVFCDKFLKSAIPSDSSARPQYDLLDTSLMRFSYDLSNWINFSWNQAMGNKLYNVLAGRGGKPSGGGNSNYSGNNHRQQESAGGDEVDF